MKVHQFFGQRGSLFPTVDILITSRDICDQSLNFKVVRNSAEYQKFLPFKIVPIVVPASRLLEFAKHTLLFLNKKLWLLRARNSAHL